MEMVRCAMPATPTTPEAGLLWELGAARRLHRNRQAERKVTMLIFGWPAAFAVASICAMFVGIAWAVVWGDKE